MFVSAHTGKQKMVRSRVMTLISQQLSTLVHLCLLVDLLFIRRDIYIFDFVNFVILLRQNGKDACLVTELS